MHKTNGLHKLPADSNSNINVKISSTSSKMSLSRIEKMLICLCFCFHKVRYRREYLRIETNDVKSVEN